MRSIAQPCGAQKACPQNRPWLRSTIMPLTSASPLASRLATVFDFLPALARRHLAARVGSRGTIQVFAAPSGVFTLVHRHRQACGEETPGDRIAQLRATPGRCDVYQLFWKKGNGRWTAYCAEGCKPFIGSIDECLCEIARDPFGCYWS